eukprot:TRINITY_DN3828_c2_g2_i3.p1 TRINITY_DN3828_c2_g2~~TRINITY_DN3828_c2_g2_i3.p1  ORF type:complete len:192 (+),score=35.46 TRINITY_DN3828_c2_g2_i3:42-578(+)
MGISWLPTLLSMVAVASAGTHYSFVRFEANGAVVTGNTDITNIGGEELPRGEWIQCKRVSYGVKRDIGTGARVSGHTHYDRIEFDLPVGPATPMIMAALERGHTVNVVLKQFHNRRDGQEEKYMNIVCTDGRLAGVKIIESVDASPMMTVQYVFSNMEIDHEGEDGATSAHFDSYSRY